MVTQLRAGRYTVRGQSLGGLYTALHVPELDAAFDCGVALRGAATASRLFLSHAHVDHLGALPALLGMRGLTGVDHPMTVYAPAEVAAGLPAILEAFGALHRWPLRVIPVPMQPGEEVSLRRDLHVRAFRTHHPVPSLGYLFFDRVMRLAPAYRGLPGAEIAARRRAGEDLFLPTERPLLAFATDTLPRVLDTCPALLEVPTLILECTFLDDRKSVEAARAGCHIHLDDLLPYATRFRNEALVLMHTSQLYRPDEAGALLARRWPPEAAVQPMLLAPEGRDWWA